MLPGFEPQLGDAGLDRGQRHFVIEVNVGDDRNGRTVHDRRQTCGVGRILHGHANDFAAFHRETVDLFERFVGVGRVRRRHRLHGDRMIPADPDALCVGLPGFVLKKDRLAFAAYAQHYITPWPLTMRAMS